jgi:UDPglucose--hexose-1-phosphate uridylyltransferase
MSIDLAEHTHRRFNPLTGEWLLVSPHRSKRPWQGKQEPTAPPSRPEYDPGCYLCPGNARASGEVNPDYQGVHLFDNDFAALLPEVPQGTIDDGFFRAESEKGRCRVICFSPRHDLSLAAMRNTEILDVVDAWKREYLSLGSLPYIAHVQIFENKGAIMGCSNPHPHGQIWAEERVPMIPAAEATRMSEHLERTGRCLLCDYLAAELMREKRIVFENGSFVSLVPFWAVWPFETMLLPKRHIESIDRLTPAESSDLADAIRRTAVRYDHLFETEFPYSMGMHQAPTKAPTPGWHLHLHYYPPLLRSATVKKFMVGYEMLAMPQRDITAEASAERLRSLPDR